MNNRYGGVIWTNHALQRMAERGISQGNALYTFNHPEESRPGNNKDSTIYYRTYGKEKIEVVTTKNEKNEWLIMSVWSRPLYGNYQKYPKYQSDNFLDKIVESILQKLFGKLRKNG